MTNLGISPADVSGLLPDDQARLAELISVHAYHEAKNHKKAKYYEGHVTLGEVNLGIALPEGMRGLEIGCSWGAKCVDVLASRSRFDGFVGPEGQSLDTLTSIMDSNDFIAKISKSLQG